MKASGTLFLLASWLLGILTSNALAQPQQSANFRITKSVLDAGGQLSTSANFRLTSAFGQPSPLGVSASANFTLYGGFLTPTFQVSPLSPVQQLVILPQDSSILLSWPAAGGAVSYKIYRSTDPQFSPSPATLLGASSVPTFTDFNAVHLPATRNYYLVTALDASGALLMAGRGPLRSVGSITQPTSLSKAGVSRETSVNINKNKLLTR